MTKEEAGDYVLRTFSYLITVDIISQFALSAIDRLQDGYVAIRWQGVPQIDAVATVWTWETGCHYVGQSRLCPSLYRTRSVPKCPS